VLLALLAALVLAPLPSDPPPSEGLGVAWGVRDNFHEGGGRFLSELTLINDSGRPLPAEGWTLYFNFVRLIDEASLPPALRLTRRFGDFYALEPAEGFEPIPPGGRRSIPFVAAHWATKRSDAPAGFYFVFQDAEGRELPPVVPGVHIEPIPAAQALRGPNDRLSVPTPESRHAENARLSPLAEEAIGRVTPTPLRVSPQPGDLRLTPESAIRYGEGLEGEARYLAAALEPVLGARLAVHEGGKPSPGDLVLATTEALPFPEGTSPEAYRLEASPEGIRIEGASAAGVFYGIHTLRALLAEGSRQWPALVVEDAPRFPYLGMHLDVARNFQPPAEVERLLEAMAAYKLNHFHFHLTDDEGWRLAIRGLPELTEVGGRRGHTLDEREHLAPALGSGPFPEGPPGSGHYSREEFVGLLRFATERHITVVPEIDVPGHARAAVRAMEARAHRLLAAGDPEGAAEFRLVHPEDTSVYRSVQRYDDNVIDVCLESSYRFLETVFDELVALYAEAGAPLAAVHVGGDEVPRGVWEGSPACAALAASGGPEGREGLWAYFLGRVAAMLDARDLAMAGWEEVALRSGETGGRDPNPDFVGRGVLPYVWNAVWGWGSEDLGYRLANAGYPVVLANASNLYFDLAQDNDPEEPGYYWAGYVDTRGAFSLAPLHLLEHPERDVMGNPVDPSAYADRVRLTPDGRGNVRGIQGQLWSETVRSPERMDYMVFPRLLALAERAWAAEPAWEATPDPEARERLLSEGWNEFAHRLGHRELPRLDGMGLAYRLPPPGLRVEGRTLRASVPYPGLALRYTTDGSEPSAASPRYTGPVEVPAGTVRVRAFDTQGRGSRTSEVEAR
jgi:hexosaminidase